MAKISIIVPIYNVEKYLKACIFSIVKQSLKDLEIIMVEDCSTDNSREVAKEIVTEYKDFSIKYIENEKNLGLSETRNIGVSMAKGDYIGFVDSDDLIHSNMYQRMYEGAIVTNYPEIVATQLCQFQNEKEIDTSDKAISLGKGKLFRLQKSPNYLYYENPSSCSKIFRKDIFENQKFLKNCIFEDFAFTHGQMIRSERILSLPEKYYFYRTNESGIMSSTRNFPNEKVFDVIPIYEELERASKEANNMKIFHNQIATLGTMLFLQRTAEIALWSGINHEEKAELIQFFSSLAYEKCKKNNDVNQEVLEYRVYFDVMKKYESDLNKPVNDNIEKETERLRTKIKTYMKRDPKSN